jgi:hypothetical protein
MGDKSPKNTSEDEEAEGSKEGRLSVKAGTKEVRSSRSQAASKRYLSLAKPVPSLRPFAALL